MTWGAPLRVVAFQKSLFPTPPAAQAGVLIARSARNPKRGQMSRLRSEAGQRPESCKIRISGCQTINCERKKDRTKKIDTVSETAGFTASEDVVRNIFGRPDRTSAADRKSAESAKFDFRGRACSDCRFERLGAQKALSVFSTEFLPGPRMPHM